MPRRKTSRTSDDLAREIERLQRQRAQAEAAEHARRGALMHRYLGGPQGEPLRQVLDPLVASADRPLFGLAPLARPARDAAPAQPDRRQSTATSHTT
jgi:hypothetical protein